MPPRPCIVCGTPAKGSRCPRHPSAWGRQASAAARGYGGEWPRISRAVREEHVARHGWVCPGFRRAPHPSRDLVGDHIVPSSRGGTNDRANIQVLCRSCNTRRMNASRVKSPVYKG